MPITNLNAPLSSFNPIEDIRSTPSSLSTASVTSASTSLAAANASRRSITFFNEGPATIFVTEGTTVSATAYQFQLPMGFYWSPDGGTDIYTGAYSGISASGTATIRVSQA